MKPEDIAVAIVALNGGEMVGRTRLQKTAYLLDQIGMKSGLEYDYHYYGPYSFDLAQGWELAAARNRLNFDERPGRHGVLYTVFSTKDAAPEKLGALSAHKAIKIMSQLALQSDVVLELAATLRFFGARGGVSNPEVEVRRRKPVKATPEGLKAAKNLLQSLGFSA